MNINLNISADYLNGLVQNNSSCKNDCNIDKFEDFFKELNFIKDKDKDDINLDIVQNILNLFYNIDNNLQIDDKKILDILMNSDMDSSINNRIELILDIFKNNNTDNENLNKAISLEANKTTGLDIINIDDNDSINSNIEILIKNLKDINDNKCTKNLNSLEKEKSKDIATINNYIDDFINNKFEITKHLNIYSGLDSISFGNNLKFKNHIKVNEIDKEINTLEKILDSNHDKGMLSHSLFNMKLENNTDEVNNQLVKEVRKEFFTEDVVKTVKYLKSNGLEEIKIKISPRELGDMTIKLIKNSEETKVIISLSKDDIFDLVNKNVGEITKHLNELNIKISEVSVDIQDDKSKFFSDNLPQEFNKKESNHHKNRGKTIVGEDKDIDEVIDNQIDENLDILI